MGRRGRQRARSASTGDSGESPVRDHMARVRVSDDVWADFRAAAGSRPLASLLAELVEAEVRRYRRERVAAGDMTGRKPPPKGGHESVESARRAEAMRRLGPIPATRSGRPTLNE
jgi:hypothetical protein